MSLQYAAEAVRSKGRGDDTMLVHMTPGEVKGLQQLAMAYGGSLTTNPDTGLPEAGFLKSLLPTLIGAGLVIGTGGAVTPLMAGFGVGGIEALRTGDIGKGLMAGLGAYGGAGLTTAAAAAAPAANVTAGGAATGLTAGQAGTVTPTLSNVGAGVGNMFSSGAAGEAARQSALTSLGGGMGATKTVLAATAAPLSQPMPMPEIEQVEYNYDGPYKPTKREVVYPGADRDPADSSEFLYFRPTNPYPGFESAPENLYQFAEQFAEGGSAVVAPPESYVPGQTAEFDYGFRQLGAQIPQIQQEAAVYNPVVRERYGFTPDDGRNESGTTPSNPDMGYIPGVAAGIGRAYNSAADAIKAFVPGVNFAGTLADNVMSDRGFKYNPITGDYEQEAYMGGGSEGYTTLSGAEGREDPNNSYGGRDSYSDEGKAASARGDVYFRDGGQVNMQNNGFVVDAHTVSEVGNGSSNAGMERFMAIGGRPIVGPGDGTSDSIPANIDGIQPAMVARDEVYMPPPAVAAYGGGSLKMGEKKLYKLMDQARASRKKNGRGQSTGLKQLVV